ncbi:MAG: hypothetical protein QOF88_5162 [Mycobacterium sp.]|nr:hypothetical protein [Mycobacterium sp.]
MVQVVEAVCLLFKIGSEIPYRAIRLVGHQRRHDAQSQREPIADLRQVPAGLGVRSDASITVIADRRSQQLHGFLNRQQVEFDHTVIRIAGKRLSRGYDDPVKRTGGDHPVDLSAVSHVVQPDQNGLTAGCVPVDHVAVQGRSITCGVRNLLGGYTQTL